MTDETKETSNEGNQTDIEQSAASETNDDVASEDALEQPGPLQQAAESVNEGEAVLDTTETPAEEIPPEEAIAQPSEGELSPAATEEPGQQPEAAPPTESPEQEPALPGGEALIEMLDVAQPENAEQQPAEGEQPAGVTEVSVSPTSDLQPPVSDDSPTIESVIEAVLFATDEALPESKLAGIVETTGKQVRECVESLNAKYEANHNAFRIEQIAGGYQMLTQPIYNSWLKKMVKVRSDNKLSPAAMETLAIIAYKQPIIRADIEAIRGVAVGEVIRSLMYKGLVKIAGRAEILGRPVLYGTTKKFLEIFGLNSVKDLPKAEDLKNPDRG